MTEQSYNGWANWETWNVALWIGNDEGLYQQARDSRRYPTHRHERTGMLLGPYEQFVENMKEHLGPIAYQTPDGVAWNDSGLDIDALDEMMEEL